MSHRPTPFVLLLAAGVLAWLLFLPPVIGLANNGDFGKLVGSHNLWVPNELEFAYAVDHYEIRADKHWDSDFLSSESLFVCAALALNRNPSSFDMRWLGLCYSPVLLSALAVLR